MKKLLLMWIMLLGMGGVISAQTPTKEVKKPIILKGGKSSFTTNCYVIEMQGWQNFIAYEDAEGVAFDENSTMIFDLEKSVANGDVRVTLYFDDGTHADCWWCLGIGTSADDTSQAWYHSFDNSTVYIKKLLGDNFEAKKDCKITKVTVHNFNANSGGLIVYQVKGGTLCGENMTIKKGEAKNIGCYAGTFTPTAEFTNIFQYKPFAIEDFQKIVVKFEEAVPATGGWKINDNTGFHSLDGKTEYVIELNGEDIEDFTIFNWNENPDPIKISEAYFYKEVVMNSPANTALLASATVTDVDSETQLIGDGKWNFETPIDICPWQYLVITTTQSAANTGAKVTITDSNGVSATTEDNKHDNFKSMYFDRWNNQNALCIDLGHLETTKGLDLTSIKSIKIGGTWGGAANVYLSQMYLTNYLSTKIAEGATWHVGDVVREYNAEGVGKYGTICLPYTASCSGAEIYSIVEANSAGITLEKVTGLLEAGKPYFYMASDEIGKDYDSTNKIPGTVRNVNFFRADLDTYDVATPIENNGLIGTFAATTAPQGDNFYVLSNNKLYYTTGATVNVGANKAYIDKSKIVNKSSEAKGRISINFNDIEATGIEAIDAADVLNNGKIYDLSGREVSQPTRGIYIMNGKKIVIK